MNVRSVRKHSQSNAADIIVVIAEGFTALPALITISLSLPLQSQFVSVTAVTVFCVRAYLLSDEKDCCGRELFLCLPVKFVYIYLVFNIHSQVYGGVIEL